jgi:hypothetical protein
MLSVFPYPAQAGLAANKISKTVDDIDHTSSALPIMALKFNRLKLLFAAGSNFTHTPAC